MTVSKSSGYLQTEKEKDCPKSVRDRDEESLEKMLLEKAMFIGSAGVKYILDWYRSARAEWAKGLVPEKYLPNDTYVFRVGFNVCREEMLKRIEENK
jgi:hypothetical protein